MRLDLHRPQMTPMGPASASSVSSVDRPSSASRSLRGDPFLLEALRQDLVVLLRGQHGLQVAGVRALALPRLALGRDLGADVVADGAVERGMRDVELRLALGDALVEDLDLAHDLLAVELAVVGV